MGLIYMKISPSGGKYIGQTIYTEENRWYEHCKQAYYKNGPSYNSLLNCAIRKYGQENFKTIILENNLPEEKLDERESYWINYYKTYFEDGHHGYNMTTGGKSGTKIYIDEKLLLNLWERGFSTIDIAKELKHDPETIRKRLLQLGLTTKDFYKQTGKKNHNTIMENQNLDNNLILSLWKNNYSCNQIAKKNGCNYRTIIRRLLWLGITKEEIEKRKSQNGTKTRKVPILQYDLEGNFIKEWESVREAAKSLGMSHGNISCVLKKKRKTAGGFIWKYKENNDAIT